MLTLFKLFICNNKYSLKQFSVSRTGSMRFESQKTWCPIDYILIISTISLLNIQSLFQLITLGSSYLLTMLNLLDVELFCLSHSTPSQWLHNTIAHIDCTSYFPSHWLYWFFHCTEQIGSSSLLCHSGKAVLFGYFSVNLCHNDCEIHLPLFILDWSAPYVLLSEYLNSIFPWIPYSCFVWYNGPRQEDHLDTSNNLFPLK